MLAAYWAGLHGTFFFDDGPSILFADGVRMASLSLESIRGALTSGHSGPSLRPVAQLSFALNYFISGFNPFAFKLTNLGIHFANSLLVFFLSIQFLRHSPQLYGQWSISTVAAFIAATWALHPIQLLAVLHAVQRMTSLSAFFLLSAFLLHIGARDKGWATGKSRFFLAWFVCWPLSILSKETGALFPAFVLVYELLFRQTQNWKIDRFPRSLAIVVGFFVAVSCFYLVSPAGQWLLAGYEFRTFSLTERLLTEGRVLWFYLEQIAFPRIHTLGLQHDDITISTGLFTPWTTFLALGGLAGLVLLATYVRKRRPLVAFGILCFLIGHTLESTILPLEIAHEHRNYLPLLGVLIACIPAILHELHNNKLPKILAPALAISTLFYFSLITGLRAHEFGEELRLTQTEAENHPLSPRAQNAAGQALLMLQEAADPNSPIHAFARWHFEQAIKLDASAKTGLLGLINLDCVARQPPRKSTIDELELRLETTPFAPGDRNILYSIKEKTIAGAFCLDRTDVDRLFLAALNNPSASQGVRAILHSWRADYFWLHLHDMAAARNSLKKSLDLVPHNSSNRLKWAQLLVISGQIEQARPLLRKLRDEKLTSDERETLKKLYAHSDLAEQ